MNPDMSRCSSVWNGFSDESKYLSLSLVVRNATFDPGELSLWRALSMSFGVAIGARKKLLEAKCFFIILGKSLGFYSYLPSQHMMADIQRNSSWMKNREVSLDHLVD